MSEARDTSKTPNPYEIALEQFDLLRADMFVNDNHVGFFERLRREDPVHLQQDHAIVGSFWNVTRYKDIMEVDTNHDIYSSAGSITADDPDEDFTLPMFIAMDPPKHDQQRKEVSPVVAPTNLAKMESEIRGRVVTILESLPLNQEFNWVDRVSIELTTQMLATLFDFPFADRSKLTRWSDVATADVESGDIVATEDERRAELYECLEYFTGLWNQRVNEPPRGDLISMLAHGESTRNMDPLEYLGNLILLIVGGNDTTRNSITGGVWFLNQNPGEYQKLRDNPGLIANMVPEIIRYQTPLAYMRRTALKDTILGGKHIKAGDKLLMWYVSGNRDSANIDRADEFLIDRPKARQHLSFGFGIHRCMGNRLAEMQLRILWEEISKRFANIEVVGQPTWVKSSFVKGYTNLPVILHAR
ncbi:MAG: cytochrome P450 [Pseudomonadales bacterium]|nr:cytochrome P450 [Pseudomonadales bacterium]MDP4639344.1 cytochrome P450 [Pseudomonadales bacterium]MDP4765972.1 cytochrome P450 [Pseudomonadales bacterium]MDP4874992.1 cytochrome P450 [Pseudomonadales bacterium]MDP4912489.1 cytochrome P450 [Pseudomonadales bacterium]